MNMQTQISGSNNVPLMQNNHYTNLIEKSVISSGTNISLKTK